MQYTRFHWTTLVVLLGTAGACTDRPTESAPEEPAAPSRQATFAPLHSTSVGLRLIPQDLTNRWIVVFHDAVPNPVTLSHTLVRQHGGTLHFTYQHVLKGFAATLMPEAVEALKQNPNVAFVEQDFHMGAESGASGTQTPVSWGPDRIDQRDRPLDNSFTYDNDGSGVNIYIVDSGIKYDEPEFGGRAKFGFDAFGGDGSDCSGHGSRVASIAAGNSFGVARGAILYSVAVLNCTGGSSASTVASGLDWIGGHYIRPAVANMSVGCPAAGITQDCPDWSPTVTQAVTNLVAAGVAVVVSAGNLDMDACDHVASNVPEAIAVGASDSSDRRAAFEFGNGNASNWGSCVDLFAPGKGILSLNISDGSGGGGDLREVVYPESLDEDEGTSFAAPFVTGVAALYLHFDWTASPTSVTAHILNEATQGRLTDLKGSPNRLLYSRIVVPSCHCPPGTFCSCEPL